MKKTVWLLLFVTLACRHMPAVEELDEFQAYLTAQEQVYLLRSIQVSSGVQNLETTIADWDSVYKEALADPMADKKVCDSIQRRADEGRALLASWAIIRQSWIQALEDGSAFLAMCHAGVNLRRIELQIPQKVKEEVTMYNQQSLSLLSQMKTFQRPRAYQRKPYKVSLLPTIPKPSDSAR